MKIFLNKIRQIVRGKLEVKRDSANSYKPPCGFSMPEIPLRKDIHPRDYSSISSFLNEKSPSFSCPVCGFNRLFASTLNPNGMTPVLHESTKVEPAKNNKGVLEGFLPNQKQRARPKVEYICPSCGYVMSFDYLTIIANMENNNE